MFLFVFFEVAHVEILFVTSFNLAHVFFPSFFVLEMDLDVLFEVGGGSERFAALIADERFFLGVDSFVSVEV